MKKILSIILTIALLAVFASCSDGKPAKESGDTLNIAALKGPTSIGFIKLINDNKINYKLAGAAEELTAPFINGAYDIISVPCNLASVLYNKTNGNVKLLAVNTLGVLYLVGTEDAPNIASLAGKTIYSTGKGTTPQYVFEHILEANGLVVGKDVTVEYVNEATELAALLSNGKAKLAVLPEPYVTSVISQNENISVKLSLTDEWAKISGGKSLVTGVVIAKKDFAEANKEKIDKFLAEYKESVEFANSDIDTTAKSCVKLGIIANEMIAKKAIPSCNIAFLGKEDMKDAVSEYLNVLFAAAPESVGGKIPADDFYYLG